MIDVKEASRTAYEHFSELYQGKYDNLSLEEVELSEDGKHWEVILGYSVQGQHSMTSGSKSREFKKLEIDAETGQFVSMRIHNL